MKILNFLSCFGNTPVPIPYIVKLFSPDDSWIKRMLSFSVMGTSDNHMVYLHQLIADTIYLNAPHRFSDYADYIAIIDHDLRMLQHNESSTDIGVFVLELIKRLNPFIKPSHNKGQKEISKEQVKWCSFIYHAVDYMLNTNHANLAEKAITLLTDSDSPLLHRYSDLDAAAHHLFQKWVTGTSVEEFQSSLNKIYGIVTQIRDNCQSINITGLVRTINYLSTLCLNAMLFDVVQQESYTFQQELFYTPYHSCFLHLEKNTIPQDRYSFYKKMDTLFSPNTVDFWNMLEEFSKFCLTCDTLSIQLQGICIVLCCYFRPIFQSSSSNVTMPPLELNNYLSQIAKCKINLDELLEKVTFLPKLDFNFCFYAYTTYFLCFQKDRSVTKDANLCIELLLQKAPYLPEVEKKEAMQLYQIYCSQFI